MKNPILSLETVPPNPQAGICSATAGEKIRKREAERAITGGLSQVTGEPFRRAPGDRSNLTTSKGQET